MIPLRLLSPCIESSLIFHANTRENSSILDIFHPLTVKYRAKFHELQDPFINHLSRQKASINRSRKKGGGARKVIEQRRIVIDIRASLSSRPYEPIPVTITQPDIPGSVESRQKSKVDTGYKHTAPAISIANARCYDFEPKKRVNIWKNRARRRRRVVIHQI